MGGADGNALVSRLCLIRRAKNVTQKIEAISEVGELDFERLQGNPVAVTSYDIREAAIKAEGDREFDERRVFEWDDGWHERSN